MEEESMDEDRPSVVDVVQTHTDRKSFQLPMPAETLLDGVPTVPVQDFEQSGSLTENIKRNGFSILTLTEEEAAIVAEMYAQSRLFFSLPEDERARFSSVMIQGHRNGWELVHFPNHDNIRQEEYRDAFSIYPGLKPQVPWPNEDFKKAALSTLTLFYALSHKILIQLAEELQLSPDVLLHFLEDPSLLSSDQSSSSSSSSTSPNLSYDDSLSSLQYTSNTNFTLFRYQDDEQLLRGPQKCMIHQDSGLLTLLPKSTLDGFEVLSPDRSHFSSVESLLQPNQIILMFGKTMQRLTRGYIPATFHRVVRSPHAERFSMPFELKVNNHVVLRPLDESPLVAGFATHDRDPVTIVPIHPAICDACGTWIQNETRYKCQVCDDFDYCSHCYAERDVQEHPHPCLKMEDAFWSYQIYDNKMTADHFYQNVQKIRTLNRMYRFTQLIPVK